MSRLDLAEIVSAVLAELDQAPNGSLARGPGGRPEVPMRRVTAADPPSGEAPGRSGDAAPTTSAPNQRATPVRGRAATPPVTVAEATACSPHRRTEREGPPSGDDARAADRVGASRSRPRRPSATVPAARAGGAAERSEAVQRIVADLQRRLGEPARG